MGTYRVFFIAVDPATKKPTAVTCAWPDARPMLQIGDEIYLPIGEGGDLFRVALVQRQLLPASDPESAEPRQEGAPLAEVRYQVMVTVSHIPDHKGRPQLPESVH